MAIALAILFGALPALTAAEARAAPPPTNLMEALERLDQTLSESTKQEFKLLPEREAVTRAHFGLGMGLRNDWGLWRGSPLATYFLSQGVSHPDDMSSIILTSYWRRLNGNPLDVAGQIACYKRWWNEQLRIANEAKARGHSSHGIPTFSCP